MYNLFQINPLTSFPVMHAANWKYLKDGLRVNLEKVIRYYHTSPMAVQADHFIIRLLQSITPSKTLPIERYYDIVDGLFSLNLGMALRMTSSLSTGHVFEGTFYGPGTSEILIAHTESFDPFWAEKHWKELNPVRVLRHPRSDLGLLLPNGKKTGVETGLAVIAINIPMLAIQYRSFWLEERYFAERFEESPRSIAQFVHMYVLPNMLPSHLDYVLFNRFSNLIKGAPMGAATAKHPFYLTDFSSKLNQVQETVRENLEKQTKSYLSTLVNIPAAVDDNMAQVFQVPDMAPTKQIVWALALARFPFIDVLTRMGESTGNAKNGQEVNKIRQAIRSYSNNHLYQSILPRDVYYDVKFELDTISDRLR